MFDAASMKSRCMDNAKTAIWLTAFLFSLMIRADAQERGFVYGLNGHPFTQAAYEVPADTQLTTLRSLGFSWYRIDVIPDSMGRIRDSAAEKKMHSMVEAARLAGVTLLPVITLPEGMGEMELYDTIRLYIRGFRVGQGFGSLYGEMFHYFELGNENDQWVIPAPAGDGSDSTSYDIRKVKLLAAYLRGMADGVRMGAPGAVTVVSNSGWRHYGYFELLETEGVRFDIIGYHWYDGMRDLRMTIDVLKTRFAHHTIWFTEMNKRSGGDDRRGNRAAKVLEKYIDVITRAGGNIGGLFVYELYNEPLQTPTERDYGMVARDPGTGVEELTAAGRAIIRQRNK